MRRRINSGSVGLTYDRVGAQFACGDGGYDVKMFATPRAVRLIAGDLLEQTGEWYRALQDLPAGCEVPPGMTTAVEAAYTAAVAWVELLDRKTPGASPKPPPAAPAGGGAA